MRERSISVSDHTRTALLSDAEPTVHLDWLATESLSVEQSVRFERSLSADERARANSLPDQRRCEYVAAHGLLRWQLSELLAVSASELVFVQPTPGAKPRLVWPTAPRLDVNLSHTAGVVASVVGEGVRVGIDLEAVDRPVAPAVVKRFLAESERLWLSAHGDRDASAIRIWTLKEAVAKALGLGLQIGFADLIVQSDPARLLSLPAQHGSPAGWWLYQWRVFGRYWCALACQAPVRPTLRRAVLPEGKAGCRQR